MNNMKKIIYIFLSFTTILSAVSCSKDYLDINVNPNSPTEGSMTPDLIAPLALHRIAAQTGAGNATQARWMGYWSRGGDYGPNNEEETYQITTNFGAGVWSNWYDILYDLHVMESKANASGQTFYEGIAKTMKVVGFMNLVDVYNNVPYTKAFDLGANITPAYDNGEEIYKDFFVKLDESMALINGATPGNNVNIANADIMFHGNSTLWKKLINTLRLKLLLRLSQVNIVDRAAELAKISPEGFLGAGESAMVNPGYAKAVSGTNVSQQNPFWDTYEADVNGIKNDRFNRANNYVLGLLRSNGDIRYTYYFDPAANGGAYAGTDYGLPTISASSDNQSGVGGPGLARSFSQDQWFLTSVESLFLQAEAAQRGWLTGVSAQAAYTAAVTQSYVQLGVTNAVAAANTYLSGSFASYTGTLQQVMMQKYLAMVGLNNMEVWSDYRRTGFPNVPLSLAPGRAANIPVRYRYPQSEYNYNPANVAAQNNPDPLSSRIFWDQ